MPHIYLEHLFAEITNVYFHHARPHKGSPVKAESLDIMRKKETRSM